MDISQLIETNFLANTAGFTGPMSGVITAATGVGSAITDIGKHVASMAGFSDLSLNGLMDKVLDVGSKFEMLKIQMAGAFAAMGTSTDINAGLKLSEVTIAGINREAAKLPGEADEYFQVFKVGFPQVRAAMSGTVKDIYAFTDKFTAFGKVQGESAMSISLGLEKLLAGERGMASARIGMWRTLLPYIHQVGEYAQLTQKQFNAMTAPERFKAVQAGLSKIQPMLDKMGDTWQTQLTTFKTITGIVTRMSSSGLFDGMKQGLSFINTQLMDSEGNLTDLAKSFVAVGRVISTGIVGAMKSMVGWIGVAIDRVKTLASAFHASPAFKMLDAGITRLAGVGKAVAGGVSGAAGNAMATPDSPLMKFLTIASERFNLLTKAIMPVVDFLGGLASIIATEVFPVFLEIQSIINAVLKPVVKLVASVFGDLGATLKKLAPTFHNIFTAAKGVFHAMGNILIPIVRILAKLMKDQFHRSIVVLTHVFSFLGKVVTAFYNAISKMLVPLGKALGKAADWVAPEDKDDEEPGLLDDILKAINTQTEELKEQKENADEGKGEAARPAAETYQDFRGSRFDITQKFAEGFDPDRVAVALASDLGRIGEQKLQSGFEPAFGSR